MAVQRDFGPNTPAVLSFLDSIREVPWFSKVGEPTERDAELIRVDFDFLAQHHAAPYAPWGVALVNAEIRIERLVFDHSRLGEWDLVRKEVKFSRSWVEKFYDMLFQRYSGYYGDDTCLYAHEMVEIPFRLLWGAVDEVMLGDLDPNLSFFGSLIPWFRRGHWPCGWQGDWPQGKLVLW